MEALHATIEMTYNGLKIDTVYLATYGYGKRIVAEAIEKGFNEEVESVYKRKININSNKELSLFLFGGKVVEEVSKCVGMYKNGKPKYKKEKVSKTVDGVVGLTFRKDLKDNAVDEENIRKLIKNLPTGSGLVSILECVLTYRSCYKEYSTYCEGLQEQLFPDNFIYGNISHVTTNTGRLSSSNPNLQNIANSDVKKAFVSRRKNGKLMEFDFSQLEVAVLAHISGDKQLIEDISTGTDIHSALYKDMHGHMPSKEERKWFKTLTFGLLYGAGAKTLATNANCSVETATKFINTFYNRYHGVYQYHEKVLIEPYDVPGRSTECNQFIKTSETQRKYVFKEYENSEWVAKKTKRKYSYSPTELKNYPVQGLATADIVPLMLGLLFRKFIKDSEVHLVNTIHDSILFDVEASAVDRVQHEVFELLNNTHVYYEKTFGVPLRLPLSAGCSVGVNWIDMTECKV
jgi:DNA polymerase-1